MAYYRSRTDRLDPELRIAAAKRLLADHEKRLISFLYLYGQYIA